MANPNKLPFRVIFRPCLLERLQAKIDAGVYPSLGVAQHAVTGWLKENDLFPPRAYKGHNEKTVHGLRIGRLYVKHPTKRHTKMEIVVLAMKKDA